MTNTAIKVENLSKMYRIGAKDQRPQNAWAAVRQAAASPFDYLRRITRPPTEEETLWALRDVSFEVQHGEVLGIIGRNGAGKSTLLKILSRITEPTEGKAVINGRIGSLLEVGTGFHPELTGRENIYLSGAILGMTRAEIDRKFAEIVGFSGVEKFLDTPFKRYSSGMRVRLGFAVAAHLDPEILLIDEVLAVGDVGFQQKCLDKMGEVSTGGRTVVFVSHSMPAIENLCDRVILLHEGSLLTDDTAADCIAQYLELFETSAGVADLSEPGVQRTGTGEATFESVRILSASGNPVSSIAMGEGIVIRMEVLARAAILDAEIGVGLFSATGLRLTGFNSHDVSRWTLDLDRGQRVFVDCHIPAMNISPGKYRVNILIRNKSREYADYVKGAASFDVAHADVFGTGRTPRGRTLLYLHSHWECSESIQAVRE